MAGVPWVRTRGHVLARLMRHTGGIQNVSETHKGR